MLHKVIIASLLLWISLPSFAQKNKQISEIIVEDNRMDIAFEKQARSIEIITQKEIQNLPVTSIAGALQYIGGLDIRQRGANGVQSDIRFRGSTFEQVLVMINGVKIIDPQTGHHIMNIPLDMDIIERIEIIKGPAARIYGQNAFAGAINIVTKVPAKDIAHVTATLGTHRLLGGKFDFSQKKKKHAYYFSASRESSDGYRPHSAYEQTNFFLQNEFSLKKSDFTFFGSFVDNGFDASSFYSSPFDSLSHEEVRTGMLALKVTRKVKKVNLKANIYYRVNQDHYVFNQQRAYLYENNHVSQVAGIDLGASTYIQDFLTLAGGLEAHVQDLKSNNLGNHNRQVISGFLDLRFHFFKEKLSILPGVSFHHYSDFGPQLFYGIDAAYQFAKKYSVFANFGTTYRVPSYTELYYQDGSNIGNPNLQPEKAQTYELGIKYLGKKIHFQLSAFQRNGQDIIDWTRVPVIIDTTEILKWKPSNITELPMKGLDGSIVWQANKIWRFSPLQTVRASYTYLQGDKRLASGLDSRYSLEHLENQINVSTQWGVLKMLHFNMGFRYVDRITQEDYWVSDLGFGLNIKKIKIQAQLSNVFGTEYEEYPGIYMPKKWWRWQLTYKF